ncbi:uncharacterized protein TNCV_2554271 [Trichonephila clavipes]|nr:uncharacterized protein TNCV_2554271 [Trichonephila clavipes]
MVHADTESCVTDSMCCATLRDVSERRGGCDRPRRSIVPSYIQRSHIRSTVVWFRPTRLPLSLKDNPQSRQYSGYDPRLVTEWVRVRISSIEEVSVGITFQDGDRFNSCQVIYSQFSLAIHQNDHQARRRFVEWAQNEIAVVPDFHKRILISDEANFWLNGYVNKQNYHIWSEANPQVYVETPLHPEKLTELWFQQDGATCHTARATIDLLKDTFGDRLISRFGPVKWPPRSCDLTPLDNFLWGYVKSLVYADKPQTLVHLEDNIRRVIADIRPQMLEKVIENWTSRLDYIRASRGSPMPEIICNATRLSFE